MAPIDINNQEIDSITLNGNTDIDTVEVNGQTVFTTGPSPAPVNRFYTFHEGPDVVREFSTDTKFKLDNVTLINALNVTASSTGEPYVTPDGTVLFSGTEAGLEKKLLSNPYDISSAGSNTQTDGGEWAHMHFSFDGLHLLQATDEAGTHFEYSLTNPFDLQTLNQENTMSLGGRANGIVYAKQGEKLLVCNSDNTHRMFDLTTPYDISTRTNVITNSSFQNGGRHRGVFISNDGVNYLTNDGDNGILEHYELGTPYDISNKTFINQFNVGSGFASGIFAL